LPHLDDSFRAIRHASGHNAGSVLGMHIAIAFQIQDESRRLDAQGQTKELV
jgi:hypothetical protein